MAPSLSVKTSLSHPLRIAAVRAGKGEIGMTLCPGKHDVISSRSVWQRDLAADLAVIRAWGPAAVVTLMEEREFGVLHVPDLAAAIAALCVEWHHLPIREMEVPDEEFEAQWSYAGARLRRHLRAGRRVVVHCRGGLGRSGTVAARLLVELGAEPRAGIEAVRAARRGAIETTGQERHVLACGPQPEDAGGLERGERVLGCLLGGAIGDALGYPVEFSSLAEIRGRFGPAGITAPPLEHGRCVVSDDTQMTLFTLEALLEARREGLADPDVITDRLFNGYLDWFGTQQSGAARWRYHGGLGRARVMHGDRAAGMTSYDALEQGRARGRPAPSPTSKGSGGLMRVAPAGLLPAWLDARGAFEMGARAAALTHGHPTGYLSAGTLAAIIRLLLDGMPLQQAVYEGLDLLQSWGSHDETTRAVRGALAAAQQEHTDAAAAVAGLGQGWVAEEALAIALYACLAASDHRGAIVIAANHDGDSDSTASVAGQIWGAWKGVEGLPHAWVAALDVLEPLLRLARRALG